MRETEKERRKEKERGRETDGGKGGRRKEGR